MRSNQSLMLFASDAPDAVGAADAADAFEDAFEDEFTAV
jgi:hypothetical protein